MNFPKHIKVYIVGGYVRDRLLDRPGKDHDFVVVGATEQDMLDLGFNPVGADFPVFLHPETGDEFALARKERKVAAGYNGFEVDFDPTVTLEEDLSRRDLTINAMAREVVGWNELGHAKLSDEVIDPFGGQKDLEDAVLRHVSDAFAEDPVRVLRVARFYARYNIYQFTVHPDTMELMKKLVRDGEINHLVPERVWTEIEKAMSEPNPYPVDFFIPLQECGALDVLMPEFVLGEVSDFEVGDVTASNLTHTALLPANSRIAALFASTTVEDIETMLGRLKAPNDVTRMAVRTRRLVELCFAPLNAERVVSTLEQVGAFQDPSDTVAALEVLDNLVFSSLEAFADRVQTVRELLNPLRAVRFNSLSDDQQANLRGPAVGAAIRDLRLDLVRNS